MPPSKITFNVKLKLKAIRQMILPCMTEPRYVPSNVQKAMKTANNTVETTASIILARFPVLLTPV